MSYCRWSSDNWKCDLYCYADINGGWTTHVANRRHTGDIPTDRFDDFIDGKITAKEFARLHKKHMDAVESSTLVAIGLAHDSATFSDATLEEFKNRLLMLRQEGYRFPDYVIDEIDEEIAESLGEFA